MPANLSPEYKVAEAALRKARSRTRRTGVSPLAAAASSSARSIAEAIETDRIVRNAIAENSLNQRNIEAAIRKELLPRLFALIGLDNAKAVVEQVIQITRVGLSRA